MLHDYDKDVMENEEIKRGVDFETRIGEQAPTLGKAFHWWEGEKFNKKTLLFLSIVFFLNLILLVPLLGKDFTASYLSSSFMMQLANLFGFVGLSKQAFFSLLTIPALLFLPVSYYLFARKIANRHELTALIASLIFVLPNPFFYSVPVIVHALINGDGSHMLIFSSLPLFLLYVQDFFRTGRPALALMASVGTATIAVISPFAAFNTFLMYAILTIAEGFLGNFRVKIVRFITLLCLSALLSAFWYYPRILNEIVLLGHVQFALAQFLAVAPLALPAIPVLGALGFLIFDRRAKLKPIFISMCLFLLYLGLFSLSNNFNIQGVFTAERYLPELAFAASLFLAILFVLLTELLFRNFLPQMEKGKQFLLQLVFQFGVALVVGILLLRGLGVVQQYAQTEIRTYEYATSIGGIKRVFGLQDITAIVAGLVSFITLLALMYIISHYTKNQKVVSS